MEIKLPKFDYISQNNTYSGSQGAFRYKVIPVAKDEIEKVIMVACYKDNCFEVEDEAGRTLKQEFEYSPEGLLKAEAFLNEQVRG